MAALVLLFLLVFFLWWPLSILALLIHPFLTRKINKVFLSFLFYYQCQHSYNTEVGLGVNNDDSDSINRSDDREETCRLKSKVASAAPWSTWTNRESIWLFTEAARPGTWYYSEYAGLPHIIWGKVVNKIPKKTSTGNQFHYQNRYLIKITRKHDFSAPGFQVPKEMDLPSILPNLYPISSFRVGEYF